MLYNPNVLTLKELGLEPRVVPERWNALEDDNFNKAFDDHTFCFDYFFNNDRTQIIFICPTLSNNMQLLLDHVKFYILAPNSDKVSAQIYPKIITSETLDIITFELDLRFSLLTRDEPANNIRIYYTFEKDNKKLTCILPSPNPSLAHRFIDRKVVVTLSKDNDLAWIKDWLFWHYKNYAVDSVIIADNQSTSYSLAQLNELLAGLDFIKRYVIINWTIDYEAAYLLRRKTGTRFHLATCQIGFLNTIRRNHLELAQGALEIDIDELLAKNPRGLDPFAFAKEFGWINFPSYNVFANKIVANPNSLSAGIGFVDHDLRLPAIFNQNPYEIQDSDFKAGISYSLGKYIFCPSSLDLNSFLFVHELYSFCAWKKYNLAFSLKQSRLFPVLVSNYMQYKPIWHYRDLYDVHYTNRQVSSHIPFHLYHCRVLNTDWREDTINRRLDWLKLLEREEPELQLEYFNEIKDFFTKYKGSY